MKKTILRMTAFVLCLCLCAVSMTACKQTDEKSAFTITVQSEGGMPLSSVRVHVYRQGGTENLVWAAMTDKNGQVSFEATDEPMEATVSELPAGYTAGESYPLEGVNNTITVQSALLDGDLSAHQFSLGDMLCDFTVETQDVSYTLSELLKTKKAVVLNFWFENCGPCRAEFPYLQNAYAAYADDIEVIAINPYDGTAESVQTYASNLKLTFPVIKAGEEWLTAFGLTSFPTTVVIDRYGMAAMIHKGAVTEAGVFENLFAYFTADDYVQTTVRNFSDIG